MTKFLSSSRAAVLGALVLALSASGGAMAQDGRDPAYAAARAAGQVGEQKDGYLGVIGSPSAEVRAMVRDINNRRRAIYTEKAAGKSTIEEYAFATACRLISQTQPGEKYQATDGSWKTRGAGAPDRDARCP
ncbi:YdbL family protein [Novosphingobium sp. ZW T3_23]|uniref:YdbL family protein n=1 Tax=Novosphingobium sp. ZW T3_23 TaxID=3378084 RepID=UPI0038551260